MGASSTGGVLGSDVTARIMFLHRFGFPTYIQYRLNGDSEGRGARTHLEIAFYAQTSYVVHSDAARLVVLERSMLRQYVANRKERLREQSLTCLLRIAKRLC